MSSERQDSGWQLHHSISTSSNQHSAAELLELVDRMRDAGAHHTIDLPTMVVCGTQSEGKCSLMERLTGVTLPKGGDTCTGTKCPIEVRMSSSTPDGRWHCDIKLRREYSDATGAPLPEFKEVAFGDSLEGLEGQRQLVHYIRAAQEAVLNPGQSPEVYVDMARAEASGSRGYSEGGPAPSDGLKFSKNAVVLVIRGAPADLTLIDLPGIIQSYETPGIIQSHGGWEGSPPLLMDETPGGVGQLVRELVQGFIRRERTIIVAAISCRDDINNQAVMDLARSVDPTGQRTIGVLTDADMTVTQDDDRWSAILKGDRFPLSLGYYAVANMDQEEPNSGMNLEATQRGAHFFAQGPFCSGSEVAGPRRDGRIGIDNLRSALSRELVNLTRKELPAIGRAIAEALCQVNGDLQGLPSLSTNPALDLMGAIDNLHTAVTAIIEGSGADMSFSQRVRDELYQKLRNQDFLATAPLFVLDPSQVAEDVGVLQPDANGKYDIEDTGFWLSKHVPAGSRRQIITLEQVQQIAQEYRANELPGQMSDRVLRRLLHKNQQEWGEMIQQRLQEAAGQLHRELEAQVQAAFKRYPLAFRIVRDLANQLHQDMTADTRALLDYLVAVEAEPFNTFTLDEHYFSDGCGALLKKMRAMRLEQRGLMLLQDERAGSPLTTTMSGLGWQVPIEELVALGYDSAEGVNPAEDKCCQVIAVALTCYTASFKRITDYVATHINHHLLSSFGPRLKSLLVQQLLPGLREGAGNSSGSSSSVANRGVVPPPAELMAEDRRVAAKRQDLLANLSRLQEAQRILNQL